MIGRLHDHSMRVQTPDDGLVQAAAPTGYRRTRIMTRRSLLVAVAAVLLAGTGAAALTWAEAAAFAPFSPDPSGRAQQFPRDSAEWLTDVAVKQSADRPSGAVDAPGPIGMKRFVGVATTPLAAAPGGPAFATLYVSAPVIVAGTEAGAAHVTAKLWMHGNTAASGPLYTAPMGVEVGWLDAAPPDHAVPGAAGKGWTPVEIDGYLPAGAAVDSLEPVWRRAKSDYLFICADCHVPHAAEDYSSMQWGIMMARMAKFAKLEPDDAMFILKWLQNTSSESHVRK
jgi:hypothetical protein